MQSLQPDLGARVATTIGDRNAEITCAAYGVRQRARRMQRNYSSPHYQPHTRKTPNRLRSFVRFVGSGPRVSRLTPRLEGVFSQKRPVCLVACVRMIGRRRLPRLPSAPRDRATDTSRAKIDTGAVSGHVRRASMGTWEDCPDAMLGTPPRVLVCPRTFSIVLSANCS
jgi:hypothetical protein